MNYLNAFHRKYNIPFLSALPFIRDRILMPMRSTYGEKLAENCYLCIASLIQKTNS